MTDGLKNFLIENKELLEENKLDELYEKLFYLPFEFIQYLTKFLLSININPLNYFKEKIPYYCFCDLDISYINIPNCIEEIGFSAFWGCEKLTSIIISKNVKKNWRECFL